jgi:hypothetical protein
MYGITPTPYEIPPELLPKSTRPKSKRPLPIALYGWYRIAWAGFSLILAMVPWGDPESKLASYAAAHPAVIVDLLPGFIRMFLPSYQMHHWSPAAFTQGLPFLFVLAALLYAAQGWMLLALNKWWRWYTMLASGLTVVQIAIGLSALMVVPLPLPISGPALAAVFMIGGWNALIFCYLAYYPGVKEAFEGQPY